LGADKPHRYFHNRVKCYACQYSRYAGREDWSSERELSRLEDEYLREDAGLIRGFPTSLRHKRATMPGRNSGVITQLESILLNSLPGERQD
jgi:hypothetical protein